MLLCHYLLCLRCIIMSTVHSPSSLTCYSVSRARAHFSCMCLFLTNASLVLWKVLVNICGMDEWTIARWAFLAPILKKAAGIRQLNCCCHVACTLWKSTQVDHPLTSLLEVNLSEGPQLKRKLFHLKFMTCTHFSLPRMPPRPWLKAAFWTGINNDLTTFFMGAF